MCPERPCPPSSSPPACPVSLLCALSPARLWTPLFAVPPARLALFCPLCLCSLHAAPSVAPLLTPTSSIAAPPPLHALSCGSFSYFRPPSSRSHPLYKSVRSGDQATMSECSPSHSCRNMCFGIDSSPSPPELSILFLLCLPSKFTWSFSLSPQCHACSLFLPPCLFLFFLRAPFFELIRRYPYVRCLPFFFFFVIRLSLPDSLHTTAPPSLPTKLPWLHGSALFAGENHAMMGRASLLSRSVAQPVIVAVPTRQIGRAVYDHEALSFHASCLCGRRVRANGGLALSFNEGVWAGLPFARTPCQLGRAVHGDNMLPSHTMGPPIPLQVHVLVGLPYPFGGRRRSHGCVRCLFILSLWIFHILLFGCTASFFCRPGSIAWRVRPPSQ